VIDIHARLGDDVQRQVLLTINSSDMSQAFSDYKKFKRTKRWEIPSERAQLLSLMARWLRKTWKCRWKAT
jgi:hypothetical protein